MLYSKIIVAYDGSEHSEKALESAIKLAEMNHSAKLEVIYVYVDPFQKMVLGGEGLLLIPSDLQNEMASAIVEKAKKAVEGLPYANVIFKEGHPAKIILEYTESEGGDLIVVGSRGLGAIGEFVLGSVSHNIVQHTKVPVLVVK
ncbi:universal stress protein [Paenibacillus filicis]|uniref:Universal stress protein n=1 Tax=Paenibacillus gyeongsangnamensis TaxID=3388067 RepID=A0ABT4QIL5_9BACL|nr:universal stress protein [Paenibacillus filicis]MCZ8516728.1 universal stress protein [Paenibacillus filicis]